MRIIGGAAGGTPLRSLPVGSLRPMLDRVKEALFNILRGDLPGAQVLDLFSGSGALGLEALSRGAARCIFVERNARLAGLIRANAERCRLADRCELIVADVLDLPAREPPPTTAPASLVLADPPYAMVDRPESRAGLFHVLESLHGQWVAGGALLVLHHRPLEDEPWPPTRLAQTDRRVYGQSQLTFFHYPAGGQNG